MQSGVNDAKAVVASDDKSPLPTHFPAFSRVLEEWLVVGKSCLLSESCPAYVCVCMSAASQRRADVCGFKTKKASVMISSPSGSLNILLSRNICDWVHYIC